MDEADVSSYWCHMCSQTVDPIMEIEAIKCPICLSGFVEEMPPEPTQENEPPPGFEIGGHDGPGHGESLWAPILLDMMNNQQPTRRRRFRRYDEEDEAESLDHELGVLMRTRRNSTAALLHLLERIRSETENVDTNNSIVYDPINRAIVIRSSNDSSSENSRNRAPFGSFGDYFEGPGLEMLLQHLAENDPNRYGTPPAKKEAVEALANVKVEETCQCSVCLDEFEVGIEVKEMPCKHKFHSECILPWLELHSSCPVCRYQLPFDESKIGAEVSRSNSDSSNEENDNGRRSLPWPFSSLFSPSGSQSGNGTSQPGSSSNAH